MYIYIYICKCIYNLFYVYRVYITFIYIFVCMYIILYTQISISRAHSRLPPRRFPQDYDNDEAKARIVAAVARGAGLAVTPLATVLLSPGSVVAGPPGTPFNISASRYHHNLTNGPSPAAPPTSSSGQRCRRRAG